MEIKSDAEKIIPTRTILDWEAQKLLDWQKAKQTEKQTSDQYNGPNYKYNELAIIQEVSEYIASTYGQHYVGDDELQTFDVWKSLGIAEEACKATLIKYAMRHGKKDGYNRKDLLKLMHYGVLLLHACGERDKLNTPK